MLYMVKDKVPVSHVFLTRTARGTKEMVVKNTDVNPKTSILVMLYPA